MALNIKFNAISEYKKLDVWILTEMTSSLANINKRSSLRFSTIF